MSNLNPSNKNIDHLFRKESGKMVAVLTHIFGSQHLELAEDVVQTTLLKALETWKFNGIPENPRAWLYRVAKNNAIDIIRKEKRNTQFDFTDPDKQLLVSEYTITTSMDNFWKENQIKDDFLGMMFACCHPDISTENQITFILKTLSGFSTKEVAKAFLTSEDIISKRLYRTKEYFRQNKIRPSLETIENLEGRVGAVAGAIYLLFNEGYNSTHENELIRRDLISQALYLGSELLDHEKTNLPEINALMALMCFHTSRIDSRIGENGEIILLKDQDRSIWNQELINAGQNYLVRAGIGNRISLYHFEALIAYEHCIAKTYNATNWTTILSHYNRMLEYKFDPVIYLHKCLVILQVEGPREALEAITKIENDKHLAKYYVYHSALGEIYQQVGKNKLAIKHYALAIDLTKSTSEKNFLKGKIDLINQR